MAKHSLVQGMHNINADLLRVSTNPDSTKLSMLIVMEKSPPRKKRAENSVPVRCAHPSFQETNKIKSMELYKGTHFSLLKGVVQAPYVPRGELNYWEASPLSLDTAN